MANFSKTLGERIKRLREEVDMSQEQLAKILQLARPTVSQIEQGKRRLSAEEISRLAQVFDVSTDVLLDLEKDTEVILAKNSSRKRTPKSPEIRINVPQRNLKKFKQVLLYILDKVGSKANIGETVIYKLLYFIDFDYYEKYEEQLIGATYMKNKYGPTPKEFKKVIERMIEDEEIVQVKDQYFQYPRRKYLPLIEPDLSQLRANEMEVIDSVLKRLSHMNAKQISEHSHNDIPWLTTEDGDVIEYESVFYRTSLYSVRSYDVEEI